MNLAKCNDYPISSCKEYLPQKKERQVHAAFGKDVTPISKILGVLSDPVRLHILLALAVQELCVCVLVEITDHKHSALSYHLKLLKQIELVDSRREGTFLLYRLTERGKAALDIIANFQKVTGEILK